MVDYIQILEENGYKCPKCFGHNVVIASETIYQEWDDENEMYINGDRDRIMVCNDCGCIYQITTQHYLSPEIKILDI